MQYHGSVAWVVELLDARVGREVESLPDDMKARFRRIVELIQNHGLEHVREPHSRGRSAQEVDEESEVPAGV